MFQQNSGAFTICTKNSVGMERFIWYCFSSLRTLPTNTVVEHDSATILHLQEFGPSKLRIVKADYLLTSVVMIQILSSCEKYSFTKSASPCRSRHLELQLKSARKWTGPSKILTNGTEFSSHFGWNGKRGIHLSISTFSGNVPLEWPEPFELPTENSGFCC